MHDEVVGLRSAALMWLAAFVDRPFIGAVGWSKNNDVLEINRLVVAPRMLRRGVRSALIREPSTASGNRPHRCFDWPRQRSGKCSSGQLGSCVCETMKSSPDWGDAIQLDGGFRSSCQRTHGNSVLTRRE